MGCPAAFQRQRSFYTHCALIFFSVILLTSTGSAQTEPPQKPPISEAEILNKYPGLAPEAGRLVEKLQRDVVLPPERRHSDLLPLLPASTTAYMAFPNYGEAAHQTLKIFRQGLDESPDLRAWWTSGNMLTVGPKIEDAVERFSQVSEYIGDEIVVSGSFTGHDPDLLVMAAVRKPGLKTVLQKTVLALADKSKPNVRILDERELATVKEVSPQELVVVVRPDFVLASPSLASLRSFNDRLDRGTRDFASNPFAQRILQSYASGVSVIGAVDLQKVVALMPHDPSFATFQRTGFADVKYAVWERRTINGKSLSQTELSFTGPRHGIASWLAAPVPLGSFDFVSPRALFAGSLALNHPSQILEDLQLLSVSNPNATASVAQMEQAFGVSLKDDILDQLSGEVTIEVDSVVPAQLPVWKAILRVKDAHRFQHAMGTILNGAHLPAEEYEEGGVSHHLIRVPSGKGATAIAYAFVDGYLVFASSAETLTEALRLHQSGGSLGKSQRFQASLPPGHSGASALFYYDQSAMIAMRFQTLMPDLAKSLSQLRAKSAGAVLCVYADEDAIREASTNPGMDVGVVLAGAAIAIPNLLRSRVAANESAAVGKMRTMEVAQITYANAYPDRGFAPDLATLGPDPSGAAKNSAEHARLLDGSWANSTCTARNWCTSSGYRFIMKASCGLGSCRDFVAAATPETSATGSRSFCSTADAVIRYQTGSTLTVPPSVKECKTWSPLQ